MPRIINIVYLTSFILYFSNLVSFTKQDDINLDDIKLDASSFDNLPGKKITSKENLETVINESDMTIFAYYYVKQSKNSYIVTKLLEGVTKKLDYLAEFLFIDCDEESNAEITHCSMNDNPDYFPKMFVLTPPKFKVNPYTKAVATHTETRFTNEQVNEKIFYDFISKNIINKGIKLNSDNHKAIVTNPNFNKVLLFTDKPQSGLIFKGLSGYFHDRLLFCEVNKSESALISRYNIERYPSLLVIESLEEDLETIKEEPEIHEYSGNLKAAAIAKFLEKFALKTKVYLNKENKDNNSSQSSEEYNKDKMINALIKKYKGDAIVPFFEKNVDKKIVLLASKSDEVTEALVNFARKTSGFFTFIRVNCLDEENTFFCSRIKGKLPQLLLLKKLGLNWVDRIQSAISLANLDAYEDLVHEVMLEIESKVEPINRDTFQLHTFNALNTDKKVPCVYFFKEGDVDIVIHLLSSDEELNKYVSFFAYSDPDPTQVKELGLKSLPDTVILAKDPYNPEK